jgi:photosystem II stability/assembly factor-like uncharacterized protein
LRDHFEDVFFLDARSGWTLSKAAPDETGDFVVSRTADGGAHWSTSMVSVAESDAAHGGRELTGSANFVFADQLHGYMSADDSANTLNTSSVLLRTSDGGATWTPTKGGGDGTIDAMAAVHESLWLLCRNGAESEVLVSRDGGRKFDDVIFEKPKELSTSEQPQYSLPKFTDVAHGYEAVTYTDFTHGLIWKSSVVLYATSDGGRSWSVRHILSGLNGGEQFRSTVAQTTWIYSTVGSTGLPALQRIESGLRWVVPEHSSGDLSRCLLDFTSPRIGWANCSGRLLRTVDGGASWDDIAASPTSVARAESLDRQLLFKLGVSGRAGSLGFGIPPALAELGRGTPVIPSSLFCSGP